MGPQSPNDRFDDDFAVDDDFSPSLDDGWRSADTPSALSDGFSTEDAFAAPDFASDDHVSDIDPYAPDALARAASLAAETADFDPPMAGYEDDEPTPVIETPHHEPAFAMPVGGEANVPRITIHMYFDRLDNTAVAEQACADRRMGRAAAQVRPGGLTAAVQVYQNQPTPSLVIVESEAPASVMLSQLDQLAEVCDPGTKVVVVGATNDIALYRELMRRGVSEYLVPPFTPLQLIQSITTLYADPSAPFVGRSVAFVGAKGGVGASTIAHNFAHALTEHMQTNAVIVDFDLPFGTAGLDFNQDPLQGVVDALSQPDRLDPVLLDRMMARCTDKLSLFAAPATLDDDYDIPQDAFEEVASKIRTTAPYVVLDLPHLWSGWMRRMLMSGDDVIVVATPDLASLRNAKNIIDLVKGSRPNDAPPRLVLNMVGMPGRPEISVKDFGEAIGVQPSLVLGFDPKLFGQASNNGQMISEVNTKSKAVEGINHLAQLISRREAPPAAKKSLLSTLLKGK